MTSEKRLTGEKETLKEEWIDYLKHIGFTEPPLERATEVVRFCTEIIRFQPSHIFVSEYRNKENRTEFESLFLCDQDRAVEANLVTDRYSYDCVSLKNNVIYWKVHTTDFDWINANDKSRMKILAYFTPPLELTLRASGENCLRLAEVIKCCIIPNLLKETEVSS